MDTPVIDFHNHAGRWSTNLMDDDPVRFISIMDAAGVDRACINCIFHGDARRGNDVVTRFTSEHPDRFIGVGFVTPHYPEEAIGELERCFDVLGMRSLKVYPTYFERPIDDLAYMPIFEWCDSRGIVVMSHSSWVFDSDVLTLPTRFIALAKRFSNIRWVLAHSGNAPRGNVLAVEAAQACPNIYLETATSFADHGAIEFLVEGAGADRVVFGSDSPLLDSRTQIGRILTSTLPDDAKAKVLGLNAIRLLGLDSAGRG